MKLLKSKRGQYIIRQSDGMDNVIADLSELIALKTKIEEILETESQSSMFASIIPAEL